MIQTIIIRYGDSLIIVANQEARNFALAGDLCDNLENLVLNSYIVLERIGRSRELGEVTQGKIGLSRLNIPPKSAFYFRKCLLNEKLIMKQVTQSKSLGVCFTVLPLVQFRNLSPFP